MLEAIIEERMTQHVAHGPISLETTHDITMPTLPQLVLPSAG